MDPIVKRNREWFGMCDHFIELDDPWAGTYCKLREGHEGNHSAHYPADPPGWSPDSGVDRDTYRAAMSREQRR